MLKYNTSKYIFRDLLPEGRPVESKIISIFLEWLKKLEVTTPSILDLGCGIGNYSRILDEHGYCVTAVDRDLNSLNFLACESQGNSISIICADVHNIPVRANQKFQVIVASEILEHLENPQSVLDHINQLLDDRGIVFVTIPNGYGLWEMYHQITLRPRLHKILYFPFYWPFHLKNWLLQRQEKKDFPESKVKHRCSLNVESPHIQFWTYRRFVKLLKQHNFELLDVVNTGMSYNFLPFYYKIRSKKLDMLDIRIVDYLPHSISSGWMFKLKKANP